VRGAHDDADGDGALSGFKRFPQWMWRNRDVLDFVDWLKLHNDAILDGQRKCGFYGMDLYSLYGSISAVLDYLDKTDADAAHRARYRYGCLEHFGEDPQAYGYAASFNIERSCEQASAVETLEATAPFVPEEAETFPTGI
jgi:erythromycin esterase-like protein